MPEVRDRLEALGYTTVNGSRTQFAAHLQTELAKWKAIAREDKIVNLNDLIEPIDPGTPGRHRAGRSMP